MIEMLVTRPEPDARDTAARLEALEIVPVVAPLFIRRNLETSLPGPEGFGALALTSANALRALEDRGLLDRYSALKVFAVGEHTAQEARDRGFAQVVSAAGSFTELVECLMRERPEGAVFYPCARDVSGDLARSLAPFDIAVLSAPVYEFVPIGGLPHGIIEGMAAGRIAAALFYSRRAAETFARLAAPLDQPARARLGALCLSEKVAEPLMAQGFVRIHLADNPSEEAMMALALSFARDQNTP